jgi:spermidine/putrescine transport system substrate-binding protein
MHRVRRTGSRSAAGPLEMIGQRQRTSRALAATGLGLAVAIGLAVAAPLMTSERAFGADEPNGQVTFGNWPLYIDIDDDTGAYPTLEKFSAETGIEVTYLEDINDNEEFFGRIQPDLAAGNPTGYDIVAPTDWMVERMIRLGYLEELDHSLLPNFEANAQAAIRDPWYDPGNRYSIPWVSGVVGIAYNPTLTGREITSFDDLFDPEFAGRVGMFSEMRDTMSMTLLSMGVVPEEATLEQVEAAQQKLLEAADRGQFRAFYGNDYYDALARGDLAISMAWGGDVTQIKLYDNPDVEFVVPETGGMLYTDAMVIPKGAANPIDAHKLMDFFYDPENATPLIEYIGYFSPVTGVADRIREDAAAARAEGDEEWADTLEILAEGAFPSDEQLENLYTYKILDEEEERTWNDLFNEVVVG